MLVRAAAGSDDDASTSASGDTAAAELKETAALDELIDVLLAGRTQQELARLVAENIVAIDKKFWLRVATRNDTASTNEEKERLQVMASAVMMIVDTVVKKTEQQLSDSSKTLQAIMTAACDEKGQWFLPLRKNEVEAVRAALDRHEAQLDDAMLSNAFAWIRKCSEDRFDTMVQLIQKVLQLYAAKQLQTKETEGVEGAVNQVLYAEEHEWGPLVEKFAKEGVITEPSFMGGLQKRMETTVLGLQSGSYAQRIQAEYLKEVEARAKDVFRDLAKSSA